MLNLTELSPIQVFAMEKALGFDVRGEATRNGAEYILPVSYWDDLVRMGYGELINSPNGLYIYRLTFEAAQLISNGKISKEKYDKLSKKWFAVK